MISQEYIDERILSIRTRYPVTVDLYTDEQLTLYIKEAYINAPKSCVYLNEIVELLAIHGLIEDAKLNDNLENADGEKIDDIKRINVTGDMDITYRDKNEDEVNRTYGGSEFGLKALELMRKCVRSNIGFMMPKC